MQTNLSIKVGAPPENAFKWLVDPAYVIQWLPNVAEYRFTNSATPSVGTH